MILFINTAEEEKTIGLSKDGKLIKQINFNNKISARENLLLAIDNLLKKERVDLKNLTGIIVVKGPGAGFTSLREGIIAANTLSFSLNIPVRGVMAGSLKKISAIKFKNKACRLCFQHSLGNAKTSFLHFPRSFENKKMNFVTPFYGKEPNITISQNTSH